MQRKYIEQLINNNHHWVNERLAEDGKYFEKAAEGQTPQVLWLGCSDSRVLPNDITGTGKGELFVHRNIANLVANTDINFLSVLQYAVEYLEVKHIIVCGHYNCGGVKAAMDDKSYGLIDNWIRPIKDTLRFYHAEMDALTDETARFNRLVELNALEQVSHLGMTNTVKNAWKKGQTLALHAWVYNIHTGLIKQITPMVDSEETLKNICKFELLRKK